MPTAERYARYRADQTTIWVTKRAAATLARERGPGEATADAVDRLLTELRARRRDVASDRATPKTATGATRGATARSRSASSATRAPARSAASGGRTPAR